MTRAAAYRCLRYIVQSTEDVQLIFKYHIDWCLVRYDSCLLFRVFLLQSLVVFMLELVIIVEVFIFFMQFWSKTALMKYFFANAFLWMVKYHMTRQTYWLFNRLSTGKPLHSHAVQNLTSLCIGFACILCYWECYALLRTDLVWVVFEWNNNEFPTCQNAILLVYQLLCFRSLDLYHSHDVERNQAIRLCRHMMQMDASALRPSIFFPFIAIANDGPTHNDRLVLISLEVLCELGMDQ